MKKLLSFFFLVTLIYSCQKESNPNLFTDITPPPPERITICHATNSESNPWVTLEINENAWPAHAAHGDINPDADGDGFTAENPCGIGDENDCDDGDEDVNPDEIEVCNDGIDNNCDGLIDCDDPACSESDLCGSCCFDDVLVEFEGEFRFCVVILQETVAFLRSANPNYGIAVYTPDDFDDRYRCLYNAPIAGFSGFIEITPEEYLFCRQFIINLAEDIDDCNNEEESFSPVIDLRIENIFGIN